MICRPIDDLVSLAQEYLRKKHNKQGSQQQLLIVASFFSRFHLEVFSVPFHLGGLTEALVCDFLHWLRDERGNGPVTLNKRRGYVLTLWRFAHRKGLVAALPDPLEIPRFREPERKPTAWTQDELERLLAACKLYRAKRSVPGWSSLDDLAMAWTIYYTAFRFSACLELLRGDLRDDGSVVAMAETQKTMADEGRWLGPDALAAIHAARAARDPARAQDERIFPWPFRKAAYWRRWKKILRAAGLASTRRDGPQKMRRTSASWMEAMSPGSAEGHLGHKTAGLAKKHYVDPLIVESVRPKSSDLLPRIIGRQRKLF